MPLVIEVPDDVAERLQTMAKQSGEDASNFAIATLREALSPVEGEDAATSHAWWASLTDEERAAQVAITARSLADSDAGRTRPASELYAGILSRSKQT